MKRQAIGWSTPPVYDIDLPLDQVQLGDLLTRWHWNDDGLSVKHLSKCKMVMHGQTSGGRCQDTQALVSEVDHNQNSAERLIGVINSSEGWAPGVHTSVQAAVALRVLLLHSYIAC